MGGSGYAVDSEKTGAADEFNKPDVPMDKGDSLKNAD
jgi:hypothetical protein